MGRKSVILESFENFGMRVSMVEFHCFYSLPDLKNSRTARETSEPTTDQQPLKNSEGYQSEPGALFLGREKKYPLFQHLKQELQGLPFESGNIELYYAEDVVGQELWR